VAESLAITVTVAGDVRHGSASESIAGVPVAAAENGPSAP